MNWRELLRRGSLLLGLASLIIALWAGMHLQHLLDNPGGRHAGGDAVRGPVSHLDICWFPVWRPSDRKLVRYYATGRGAISQQPDAGNIQQPGPTPTGSGKSTQEHSPNWGGG